jgi:hypothetical protein
MDCKRVSRLIDAYAAGELGGDRADEVKAHVEGCASCAKTLEECGLALSALRSDAGAAPEADARFFHKLSKRLDDVDRRAGMVRPSIINWRSAFGIAAAAAAVFIISVQFVPMTTVTGDRAVAPVASAERTAASAMPREESSVPPIRWRPSSYTPVSMSSAQKPLGLDPYERALPRFVFPTQVWPIEGTHSLEMQSTISRVDYEHLEGRVHDLELRLDALEHKAQ